MQNVTCYVDDYSNDADGVVEVRVEGRNLPEGVAARLAAWAISLELGVDLKDVGDPSGATEEGGDWFLTFEV